MARPDFPRSLPQFFKMFPEEKDCLRFVVDSRWPGGDKNCPKCRGEDFYDRSKDRPGGLQCKDCGYMFSATAGTVMENTKLPLCLWLQAAYLMVTDKRGISGKQLQRDLGIKRYETAYMLLQRLRAAMVDPDRERLRGRVEVDESFVGGVKHGKKGRQMAVGKDGKFIVLGAVEVRQGVGKHYEDVRRPGRIRLRHVPDTLGRTLVDFVSDTVTLDSVVVTDGNPSYNGISRHGYDHEVESTALGMKQDDVLPRLHLVFSNLKTWLAGTFHGRVEAKHLQGYLNEFCFRFNRRDNLYAAFQTVLGIAPKVEAPTYEKMYASGPGRFVHPNPGGRPPSSPRGGRRAL